MKTLVLADRNPDTRRILRDYLAPSGWSVLPCATAEELSDLVRGGSVDAVVLELFDLRPGGLILAKDIAAGRLGSRVPVLVYTSDPRRSLLRELDLPGIGLLTKPASPRAVLRALEAVTDPVPRDLSGLEAAGGAAPEARV